VAERLRVLYEIEGDEATAHALAHGIALEQSVELPAAAIPPAVVAARVPGEVESIEPAGADRWQAWVSYHLDTTGFDTMQLLNVLFGNTSMQTRVALLDADLPPALLAAWPGPRVGIPGLRARLGAAFRALTCTALKPVGYAPSQFASLVERFARAGIDVIKEDHGIANQRFAPFAERVRLCQEAIARAAQATGRRALYVPNLSGPPATLRAHLELAHAAGVEMVMLAPMLCGLPTFAEIAAQAAQADIALLAHCALAGTPRIAADFLLGRLYRLIGADAVIFVNHGGRFGWPPDQVRRLATNLRAPWGNLRPAFPVPAGGMTTDRVAEMIDFYGPDTLLLISGALYPDNDGLEVRARAFVEAAHAPDRERM
jgi:ribulose-bisphosphate carboxylase large chain